MMNCEIVLAKGIFDTWPVAVGVFIGSDVVISRVLEINT
jgi:hypothetical protein